MLTPLYFTANLMLRPLRKDDKPRLMKLAENPAFQAPFLPENRALTAQVSTAFDTFLSNEAVQNPNTEVADCRLAVCLRRSGRLVGWADFNKTSKAPSGSWLFLDPRYPHKIFQEEADDAVGKRLKSEKQPRLPAFFSRKQNQLVMITA